MHCSLGEGLHSIPSSTRFVDIPQSDECSSSQFWLARKKKIRICTNGEKVDCYRLGSGKISILLDSQEVPEGNIVVLL